MTPVVKKGITSVVCLLACTWIILSVTPKYWELFTQKDLFEGKLQGVSITSDGKILPAPRYEPVFETEQALVFSMTSCPDSNLYLGTGHDGAVYKVNPQGVGELALKTNEIDIFALACDQLGNLYVGSSPDGKVYRVGSSGKPTEFFDPDDKYIWDLVVDKKGILYVATGSKGLIYRVDLSGKASVFFDSDDSHLMSLTFDLDGNIIAGSAPGGLIYRISKEGKAFVLLDTPLSEIRRVAVDRLGDTFAIALAAVKSSGLSLPERTGARARTLPGEIRSSGSGGVTAADSTLSKGGTSRGSLSLDLSGSRNRETSNAKSILYRITKAGTMERIWSSKTEMVFDFVVRDDGKLLLGTGTKGRILAVDPQRSHTILVESQEEQVTRLLARGNDVFAATSNMGKLYRLQPLSALSGTYQSSVFDAGLPSAWGQIRWKARTTEGSSIEIFTRSGNTATQDKTWSQWDGPYQSKDGEAIQSPLARYVQWKAVFKSAGGGRKFLSTKDALENLTIAYLQQNVRPRVSTVEILRPGVALQKIPLSTTGATVLASGGRNASRAPAASSSLGRNRFRPPPRRIAKPGTRSMTWKASDENNDELIFSIYFRGERETEWKLLKAKLKDDFYTIDSNALPDGLYTVKVVASDAPSNPYGKYLTGELISKPFVINNSAPTIQVIQHTAKGRRVEITYRAKDTASQIFSSEFSMDGGTWHLLFPKDGIADSLVEEYVLLTPEMVVGEHVVGLRVTDTVGNVGTSKLIVKIQK